MEGSEYHTALWFLISFGCGFLAGSEGAQHKDLGVCRFRRRRRCSAVHTVDAGNRDGLSGKGYVQGMLPYGGTFV